MEKVNTELDFGRTEIRLTEKTFELILASHKMKGVFCFSNAYSADANQTWTLAPYNFHYTQLKYQ